MTDQELFKAQSARNKAIESVKSFYNNLIASTSDFNSIVSQNFSEELRRSKEAKEVLNIYEIPLAAYLKLVEQYETVSKSLIIKTAYKLNLKKDTGPGNN